MTLKEFMSRIRINRYYGYSPTRAKKMTNKDISSLIIVDKSDAPVGIVSERDIVRKCCSREDLDIKLATVSEIMSYSCDHN